MKEFWDSRYSEQEYAYGTEPNQFFKSALDSYAVEGSILFPAEGEGRNAIYAAKKGLDVYAFDISEEGKKKALKLAKNEKVSINYEVGELFNLNLIDTKFNATALIFAHFPTDILKEYHQKIADLIKPKGIVILEGYSKNHTGHGGPKNRDMLFTKEMIQQHFSNFKIISLVEKEVKLSEGKYHQGLGTVIRFIGEKIS
ncbi:Methyltransferase domain-containing protein [Lutibacter oricola]|uniref:Methyltransferase domain-containing protein n=1 Tax=Lutibacter oricola TaxID=762486 RepID=A0A1H2T3U6_9FLAO|nr:class I SAM-dependent methyltransferase [Lutibacter oricola]SDW38477.1 Methyltransferase domain-containing protein [Lutibacter oricola]